MITSVIFDLNGTILSDEDEYGTAFKNVLKTVGVEALPNYPHERGTGVEANWKKFIKKYNMRTELTPVDLAKLTQKEYLKLMPRVTLTNGFIDFIRKLKDLGIKTALATSNSRQITSEVLEKYDLRKYFDVVICGDEVKNNKPNPEIFLLTAKRLGSDASQCVVFEDSPAGTSAAKSAGMKVYNIGKSGSTSVTAFVDFTHVDPDIINQ
jgi:beta-phosphoglucomutase